MLEKMFKLKEHDTSFKTEVIARLTTFTSIAYILAVLFVLKYIFL